LTPHNCFGLGQKVILRRGSGALRRQPNQCRAVAPALNKLSDQAINALFRQRFGSSSTSYDGFERSNVTENEAIIVKLIYDFSMIGNETII
jgi:hypothetical protein